MATCSEIELRLIFILLNQVRPILMNPFSIVCTKHPNKRQKSTAPCMSNALSCHRETKFKGKVDIDPIQALHNCYPKAKHYVNVVKVSFTLKTILSEIISSVKTQ